MRKVRIAAAAAALWLLAGDKAQAADSYQVDPLHSFASFSIGHLGIGLVRGSFSGIAGTIVLDEQDAAKSAVEVTIKTASVDTRVDKRDEHLRSPDFFDVERYPAMTFTSTKVARRGGLHGDGRLLPPRPHQQVTVEATHLGSGKDPPTSSGRTCT